jgi:nucleoside-diphosphate-sugar epimerase
MRVLIVGAGGSLGRQLAPELAERGHEVVCFDLKRVDSSPFAGCWAIYSSPWPWWRPWPAARRWSTSPRGTASIWRTVAGPIFWRLNVDGAFNAFEAALTVGARRVLYCSAMGVYGGILRPSDRPLRITDESPVVAARDTTRR